MELQLMDVNGLGDGKWGVGRKKFPNHMCASVPTCANHSEISFLGI